MVIQSPSSMKKLIENEHVNTIAIDTPGGKRNLKMKIKAQQMTFRQDIIKI